MAVKTPLRLAARKLGDLIRAFGAGEGLRHDEFAIAGTFDEPTERFYLTVGSIRPIDRYRWHSGILNAIRKDYSDTSWLVLVVRNVNRIDQVYDEMVIGDGEVDVTDMF
jgi:hypothetical protein